MAKKHPPKHQPLENRELHQAMFGRRFSSAASLHTLKRNKGARNANKRNAIRDFS